MGMVINVKLNLERKMKVITSDLNKYEKDMKEETKNMKHLINKIDGKVVESFSIRLDYDIINKLRKFNL